MKLSKSSLSALNEELEPGVATYVGILALTSLAVAGGLISAGYGISNPWPVAALCVIAAVSERAHIRLTSTTSQSISILPTLFAAVLFGPLAAMLVGAASLAC